MIMAVGIAVLEAAAVARFCGRVVVMVIAHSGRRVSREKRMVAEVPSVPRSGQLEFGAADQVADVDADRFASVLVVEEPLVPRNAFEEALG